MPWPPLRDSDARAAPRDKCSKAMVRRLAYGKSGSLHFPETKKAPPQRGFSQQTEEGVTGEISYPLFRKPTRICNALCALHIHAFHSAHSAHAVSMAPGILLLFDQLSHHRLGGEQQPGDGRRVL